MNNLPEQKTETGKAQKLKGPKLSNLCSDYAETVSRSNRLFLLWAFLIPMGILFILYAALKVYPLGEGSVLVLDMNGQYVYFFEELRSKILSGGSLLYSWSRSLGGEFLGIFAYYLASPFSLLVCLFPKAHITEALLLIFLLKSGSCGFTMALYLKQSYPSKKSSIVTFSTMYALCSYAVVQAHNTMWIDALIFLPLIVLGIERLIKKKDFVLYVVSLACCTMSNFYIGYMTCIFTFFYFFYYYIAKSADGENNPLGEKRHFLRSLLRMLIFSVIALEIAMAVLYPAYISLLFGKTTFSDPSFEFVQKFDFLDLIAKLFPASYDTVRPEGLPFVYCGTLTLIMLPMFFLSKRIKAREKYAGGLLIAVFVFSFMGSTIDIVWHGFQKPNWLNYRYSFMLVFIMIVFAYRAFTEIKTLDYKHVVAVCGCLALLLIIIQKQDYEWLDDIRGIWISMGFVGIYLGILYLVRGGTGRLRRGVSVILLAVVCAELCVSGICDEFDLDKDVIYSTRSAYQNYMNKLTPMVESLKDYDKENFDSKFYRMEKTSHKKTNDPMALGMYGISNSTSTLNASVISFLQDLGYASRSHWSKYLGGTPLSDSLLGIKYIINTKHYNTDLYTLINSDNTNDLFGYYNQYALSLCYGVSQSVNNMDFDDYASPFERMNAIVTAMLGESTTVEIFKPIKAEETRTNVDIAYTKVTETSDRHTKYSPTTEGQTAKVSYKFTGASENNEIYCFFPSDYPRKASLYLEGSKLGSYFDGETFRITELGVFPTDKEVSVELQLEESNMYILDGADCFYYLDSELFKTVMERLGESQLNITSFYDTKISGTVNVNEGDTLMFTSIPYDEGWKVKVDGKSVETKEVLDSLMAFNVTSGQHTVELKYRPNCYTYGVIISIAGLITFAAAIIIERPESISRLMPKKRRKNKVPAPSDSK